MLSSSALRMFHIAVYLQVTLQDVAHMTRDDLYAYKVAGFKDANKILERVRMLSRQSDSVPLEVSPPHGMQRFCMAYKVEGELICNYDCTPLICLEYPKCSNLQP